MGTIIQTPSELAETIKQQQVLSGQFLVQFVNEHRVILIGWDGLSFCACDGNDGQQVFDESNVECLLPLQLHA